MNRNVYVISWKYYDSSAYKVVRVYTGRQQAEMDLEMLEDNCMDKVWRIEEIPLIENEIASAQKGVSLG